MGRGGDATIDQVENEDRLPFLAFGRMDCREDQVILVEERNSRLLAGRVRWIQRELGEKTFARWITACDLFELEKVGTAHYRIFVHPLEMRLIPKPSQFEVRRPFRFATT